MPKSRFRARDLCAILGLSWAPLWRRQVGKIERCNFLGPILPDESDRRARTSSDATPTVHRTKCMHGSGNARLQGTPSVDHFDDDFVEGRIRFKYVQNLSYS